MLTQIQLASLIYEHLHGFLNGAVLNQAEQRLVHVLWRPSSESCSDVRSIEQSWLPFDPNAYRFDTMSHEKMNNNSAAY